MTSTVCRGEHLALATPTAVELAAAAVHSVRFCCLPGIGLHAGHVCRQLLPAVVFCFSKKKVDSLADTLASMDFTSASEKSKIHLFFDKAVSRLKGTDRELPQILRLREMLRRGLGIHHAGAAQPSGRTQVLLLPRVLSVNQPQL